MRPLLVAAALALVSPTGAAQSHHPGPVVLLGMRADPQVVPELVEATGTAVLLVATSEPWPRPLDARAWGGGPQTEVVRLLPAREAEPDRALLTRVRGAGLIALGPGSPKEWLDALLDRERSAAVLNAIHEAWSDGAILVGRGDSAALLSAAFSVSGPDELDWDVRNPRSDDGSRAAQGLGYQPWAMIDTDTRSAGSLRRLVRSLCRERIELALWLPAGGAIVADLTAARLRVHGEGEVLVFDTRRARRTRKTVQGARLTVLPPGSSWDVAQRRVALPAEPARAPGRDSERRVQLDDLHDARSLGSQLATPEGACTTRWIVEDRQRRLELRYDESSRWGRIGIGEGASRWIEALACDLPAGGR